MIVPHHISHCHTATPTSFEAPPTYHIAGTGDAPGTEGKISFLLVHHNEVAIGQADGSNLRHKGRHMELEIYSCIHTHLHTHIHTPTHTYTHIHTHTHTIHEHTHTYTHTHTHTHTYTHTQYTHIHLHT